jgi:hypothetical protein
MGFAIALSDEQWAMVADLFDPPGRRGAPAQIPRRQMVEVMPVPRADWLPVALPARAVGYQELDQSARVVRLAGRGSIAAMFASLLYLVLRRLLTLVAASHRSDAAAQVEMLVLRHQLGIAGARSSFVPRRCCVRRS